MKKNIVNTVKSILKGSGVRDIAMDSEEDLQCWLENARRFRDLNQVAMETLEKEYDAFFDTEDRLLAEFDRTHTGSLKRRRCLQQINRLRKDVAKLDEIRLIREKNLELNTTLIREVEKAMAIQDLGMDMVQVDDLRETCENAISDYGESAYAVDGSWSTRVYDDVSPELEALEQELLGTPDTVVDTSGTGSTDLRSMEKELQ